MIGLVSRGENDRGDAALGRHRDRRGVCLNGEEDSVTWGVSERFRENVTRVTSPQIPMGIVARGEIHHREGKRVGEVGDSHVNAPSP